MSKEADDHLGSVLQAGTLAAGQTVPISDCSGQRDRHGAFDAGIALLLRVELWGMGRQIGHRVGLRVCCNEFCGDL